MRIFYTIIGVLILQATAVSQGTLQQKSIIGATINTVIDNDVFDFRITDTIFGDQRTISSNTTSLFNVAPYYLYQVKPGILVGTQLQFLHDEVTNVSTTFLADTLFSISNSNTLTESYNIGIIYRQIFNPDRKLQIFIQVGGFGGIGSNETFFNDIPQASEKALRYGANLLPGIAYQVTPNFRILLQSGGTTVTRQRLTNELQANVSTFRTNINHRFSLNNFSYGFELCF